MRPFASQLHRIILILSTMWLGWLAMTLLHELGHVIGALCTGGVVRRVVWHPLVMSRTDVDPNPHMLVETWAGPILGCVLPIVLASVCTLVRQRCAYLAWTIAGFCLIANGCYLGVGTVDPVGDARVLVTHGAPRWTLVLFGIAALLAGGFIWHRCSGRFGFGSASHAIEPQHAWWTASLSLIATLLGLLFGTNDIP
ncbi:MAG: hypothetical protein QM770_05485 [Tepidisphaeraceae bacterium]